MPVVDVPGQRAAHAGLAVLDVGAQRVLEADGLADDQVVVAHRRVERAVEHEAADVLRVQLRVRRTEERAVGEARVVQLRRRRGPRA